MNCKCCKAKLEVGRSFCVACGFPTLADALDITIEPLVEAQRKKLLDSKKLAIKTYCYSISEDGDIEEPKTVYSSSFDAIKLVNGKVLWFNGQFEALPSNREFEVELVLTDGEIKKELVAKINPNSQVIDHSNIGICMVEGFKIKVVVGKGENLVYSNEISII